MTFYEAETDPAFPWQDYVDASSTPAVVISNNSLTATYVASRMRNAGMTSEQLQGELGLTDNEIRACVACVDAGHR